MVEVAADVAAAASVVASVQDADAGTVVAALAHAAYQVVDVQDVVDTVEWEVRLVDQAAAGTFAFVGAQLDDVVAGCVVAAVVWALAVVVAVQQLEWVLRLVQPRTLEQTCPQGPEEVTLGKWRTRAAGRCEAILLLLRALSRPGSSFD